ncbi:MAG TPA: hypothetical protein DCY20_02855 [Firmicutes bacterium]|nr:hypothetical protein [Bacillota bacterium]
MQYDSEISSYDKLIKVASFDISQLPNQNYKVYANVNGIEEQIWLYDNRTYEAYQSGNIKMTVPRNSRMMLNKAQVTENNNTVDALAIHGENFGLETKFGTAASIVLLKNGKTFESKSLVAKDGIKKLSNANKGIDLSKLEDGVYQIAIKDTSGTLYNLRSGQIKNNKYTAYTIRRNNQLKEVQVNATKGVYPTITVTTKAANSTSVADVMLDPGHGGDYNPGTADSGACSSFSGISCENTEMLSLMKMVRQGLESHGLKVAMTREINHSGGQLPLYGKNSRTDKVYQSGAKVTIASHYNSAGTSNRGAFAMHPMQNTNDLANRIIHNLSTMANQPKDLNQHTACDVTKKTGDGTSYGYDNNAPTSDCYYMVREYGGNITNGHNKDANGNLYRENYLTPEPVLVEYFNGANSSDANNYKNNKSKYADSVVKAIVEYFGMSYKKTLITEPFEPYTLDTYDYEIADNLK